MPNGKTHDKISYIFAILLIFISTLVLNNIYHIILLNISFLFSSFYFNGDLDCNSKVYNRWKIFKLIWVPYQEIFHHRSVFTHGIIIGTLVRAIYVGILPTILIYYYFGESTIILFINKNQTEIIFVLIGIELGNTIHTISDWLF